MGIYTWILRDDIGTSVVVNICSAFPNIMLQLKTRRLMLRHFHILDSEPMYRVFGDAEVMRFGDGVQTRKWDTFLVANLL